jgi:hypothetical protein
MTPTYPKWDVSHVQGISKTQMQLFNKRKDVEYYEIGVFDEGWEPVPFVSAFKLMHLKYLGHATFDVYIRNVDVPRAEYICSKSKLRGDDTGTTLVSSKVCSRFK